MLYEVITCFLFQLPLILHQRNQFPSHERKSNEQRVITSYSIHYTKLYEAVARPASRAISPGCGVRIVAASRRFQAVRPLTAARMPRASASTTRGHGAPSHKARKNSASPGKRPSPGPTSYNFV